MADNCKMKLKIEEIVIPNLNSLYQSFNADNDYKPTVSATFCDLVDMDALIDGIKKLAFDHVEVLNEADAKIATVKINGIKTVERNISNDEVRVQIIFE